MSEAPFNLVTIFLIIQTIAITGSLFFLWKSMRQANVDNQEKDRTISLLLNQDAEKIRLHWEEQERNRRAGDRLYVPRPIIKPTKPVGTEPPSNVSNVAQDTSSHSSGCSDSGSSSASGGSCN